MIHFCVCFQWQTKIMHKDEDWAREGPTWRFLMFLGRLGWAKFLWSKFLLGSQCRTSFGLGLCGKGDTPIVNPSISSAMLIPLSVCTHSHFIIMERCWKWSYLTLQCHRVCFCSIIIVFLLISSRRLKVSRGIEDTFPHLRFLFFSVCCVRY